MNLILSDSISEYLSPSEYIDWKSPAILAKAEEFKGSADNRTQLIKNIYEFVRDEIKHSWDIRDPRITRSASEAFEYRTGICWSKANLLAALLRACNIPAGICYQRLTLGDTPETGFCIHALNAVYIEDNARWIRLDARGNKPGVDAQFSLDCERLAFPVRSDIGEMDYDIIYAYPSQKLMNVLENSTNAIDMYLHHLPDTL